MPAKRAAKSPAPSPKGAIRGAAPAAPVPARELQDLQPEAEKHWKRTDPVMHALSKAHPLGPSPVVAGQDGFSDLVQSIVHQQVSLAAGRTIHGRLVDLLGGKVTPERVAGQTPERLRTAGLSRSKAAYILDLAAKALDGEVEFDRFPAMPDDEVIRELVAVKGIGTWTAKMFLIFHLRRPDVLAPEDLGLRLAVAEAYGVPMERTARVMLAKQAAWSPYCSVAARVLWTSRRAAMAAEKVPAVAPKGRAPKRGQRGQPARRVLPPRAAPPAGSKRPR